MLVSNADTCVRTYHKLAVGIDCHSDQHLEELEERQQLRDLSGDVDFHALEEEVWVHYAERKQGTKFMPHKCQSLCT